MKLFNKILLIYCVIVFNFNLIKCNNSTNNIIETTTVLTSTTTIKANQTRSNNSNRTTVSNIKKRDHSDQIAVPVVYSIQNRHLWRKPQPFETTANNNNNVIVNRRRNVSKKNRNQPSASFTYTVRPDQNFSPTVQYYGNKAYYDDILKRQESTTLPAKIIPQFLVTDGSTILPYEQTTATHQDNSDDYLEEVTSSTEDREESKVKSKNDDDEEEEEEEAEEETQKVTTTEVPTTTGTYEDTTEDNQSRKTALESDVIKKFLDSFDPIIFDEEKKDYRPLSEIIGPSEYERSLKQAQETHKNLHDQTVKDYKQRKIDVDTTIDFDEYRPKASTRQKKKTRKPRYKLVRILIDDDEDDDQEEELSSYENDKDFKIEPVFKVGKANSKPVKEDSDHEATVLLKNEKIANNFKYHPKFIPLINYDNTNSGSEPVFNVREYPEYHPLLIHPAPAIVNQTTVKPLLFVAGTAKNKEVDEQAESRTNNVQLKDSDSKAQGSAHHHEHHKKKNEHFKKGGGKKHDAEHHSKHGEKGDKGYKGYHKHEKGQKGHHDKEGHKGSYEDHAGHKKKHDHEEGHFHEHKKGEHGEKGAKYGEHGKHEKGHSTKGEHNIHKKDEYEKKHEFFDEYHEGGESEKHGGFHEEHEGHKGGHHKSGHHKSGHDKVEHGKKGKKDHGGHFHEEKGHKNAGGHEGHHDHESKHGKKEGHHHGKKWGYKKGKHRR